MAINYFQELGLNSYNPAQALSQGQAYKMNQFNLDTAKAQEAERIAANQQNQQAAQIKFANDQQKARAAQGAGAFYNALNSGNKQAALTIAQQYQDEINGLGDPSFTVDSVSELLQTPEGTEQLKQMSLGMVQMAGGPEQFAKFTESQQVKPMTAYERAQSQAKQQDLAFKGQEVGLKGQELELAKQKLDLERETKKLEAMQKSAAATANDLKREELQLKIDEQKRTVEEAKAQRQADYQVAESNIANTVATLEEIINTDIGTIEDVTGPIDSMLPTLGQDEANFEETINKFDSQAFLAQIPQLKGTGALSEAEGKKLSAALQNMSLRQSPDRIISNAKVAKAILDKALTIQAQKLGQKPVTQSSAPVSQRYKVEVIR